MISTDNKIKLNAFMNSALVDYGRLVEWSLIEKMVFNETKSDFSHLFLRLVEYSDPFGELPNDVELDFNDWLDACYDNLSEKEKYGIYFNEFNSESFAEEFDSQSDSDVFDEVKFGRFVSIQFIDKDFLQIDKRCKISISDRIKNFITEFDISEIVEQQEYLKEFQDDSVVQFTIVDRLKKYHCDY